MSDYDDEHNEKKPVRRENYVGSLRGITFSNKTIIDFRRFKKF